MFCPTCGSSKIFVLKSIEIKPFGGYNLRGLENTFYFYGVAINRNKRGR